MRRYANTRQWIRFLVIGLTLCLAGFAHAGDEEAGIRIIAHPDVKLSHLDANQLRKIFSMRQSSWPDGQALSVFVLQNTHPTHQQFCKEVLRMFPYQIQRTWDKLVYSGIGEQPNVVEDTAAMLEKVRNTPGAIGYLAAQDAMTGVKQIEVEQEKP